MTITPADFIHPPYARCPHCGENRFGLLSVHARSYSKRCAACLYAETRRLPEIRKRVIYLDQPAISNMMFALNPATRQHREGRVDPFWLRLFEKLDRLSKLQLIVCPDTDVQEHESLAYQHFEALRQTYEQLSGGVSFYDAGTIERFQLQVHARNWLAGRPDDIPQLDSNRITHGDLHGWTDILLITVRGQVTEEQVDAVRQAREQTHDGLTGLFEKWRTERGVTFTEWYERELKATGETTLQVYWERVKRMAEVQMGVRPPALEDLGHPPAVVLVTALHRDLVSQGVPEDEALAKVQTYLRSPHLRHVPSVQISAMLWASVARKAAAGRRRPPTRGAYNDVRVISSILPYCDAMFIDNEMRGYLAEEPLRSSLQYPVQLFSQNNRDEILTYLDDLETAANPKHFALVRAVYGDDVGKPFVTMFGAKGPTSDASAET
jgi:hypothetical protein